MGCRWKRRGDFLAIRRRSRRNAIGLGCFGRYYRTRLFSRRLSMRLCPESSSSRLSLILFECSAFANRSNGCGRPLRRDNKVFRRVLRPVTCERSRQRRKTALCTFGFLRPSPRIMSSSRYQDVFVADTVGIPGLQAIRVFCAGELNAEMSRLESHGALYLPAADFEIGKEWYRLEREGMTYLAECVRARRLIASRVEPDELTPDATAEAADPAAAWLFVPPAATCSGRVERRHGCQ